MTIPPADATFVPFAPEVEQGIRRANDLMGARGALAAVGNLWQAAHQLRIEANATEAGAHAGFPRGDPSTIQRTAILRIAATLIDGIADKKMDEASRLWIGARSHG